MTVLRTFLESSLNFLSIDIKKHLMMMTTQK